MMVVSTSQGLEINLAAQAMQLEERPQVGHPGPRGPMTQRRM